MWCAIKKGKGKPWKSKKNEKEIYLLDIFYFVKPILNNSLHYID